MKYNRCMKSCVGEVIALVQNRDHGHDKNIHFLLIDPSSVATQRITRENGGSSQIQPHQLKFTVSETMRPANGTTPNLANIYGCRSDQARALWLLIDVLAYTLELTRKTSTVFLRLVMRQVSAEVIFMDNGINGTSNIHSSFIRLVNEYLQ